MNISKCSNKKVSFGNQHLFRDETSPIAGIGICSFLVCDIKRQARDVSRVTTAIVEWRAKQKKYLVLVMTPREKVRLPASLCSSLIKN